MKVRFNRGAFADIAEILDYLAERHPRAAAGLSREFEAAGRLIGEMTDIGALTSRRDFRRLVCGNYLVVYELKLDEAIIHYVRHGARKRPWEGE